MEIIRAILGLALLYALWRMSRELLLAEFRERLYHVRNDLFCYARKNKIDFSSDAYMVTRYYINARIKYLKQISFINLMVHLLLMRKELARIERDISDEFLKKIYSLADDRIANHLKAVKAETDLIALRYFAYTMPIVGIPLIIYKVSSKWASSYRASLYQ